MINYFKYELKKSIRPIIIFTAVTSLIYVLSLVNNRFYHDTLLIPYDPGLGTISTLLAILCVIIPIYMFSYNKQKRNLDYYYSLPISRIKFAFIRFIVGFIEIMIPYTISYIIGLAIVLSKGNIYFINYYFPLYFYSLLLALSLYSFNTFIYSRASSIADGVIFIFLASFILLPTINLINNLFNISDNIYLNGVSFYPITNLTIYYTSLIMIGRVKQLDSTVIFSYILWTIIGVSSFIGLLISLKTDKVEKAEQISTSFFGYKTMIPIYLVTTLGLISSFNLGFADFLLRGLIVIMAIIGYMIYRRKFIISYIDFLILVISVIGGILIGL